MCKSFNYTMHSECFQCSTCGASLKNQGHHFINDKFYCDIHGSQQKGRDIKNNILYAIKHNFYNFRKPNLIKFGNFS